MTTDRQFEDTVAPLMPATVQNIASSVVKVTAQQQKPVVSHACTQTVDVPQVNEHREEKGSVAVEEELLHISLLNTSVNSADLSFDVGNISLSSLQDISISDLVRPDMADVPSTSSDGVTALQSLECTQLVESESSKVDVLNGPTASTSKQTGDMSVAIVQSTSTGIRIPFTALCSPPQRARSERKRKKPPSYCLTSTEHFEYITPPKKTNVRKKGRMTCHNQMTKGQSRKQEPSKRKAEKNGTYRQKPSKENENKGKTKVKKTVATKSQVDDHTPCHFCGKQYDTPDDDKNDEEWLCCVGCTVWAHESCAETNGIIGDAGNDFLCKSCCD